jgi:hypothetical protein
MSRIFYDHLIILNNLELKIIDLELEPEEKEAINQLVEETVHYRVMTKILDLLPKDYHEEFLDFFYQAPHEENLLSYLQEKIEDIEAIIKKEIDDLEKTLLEEFSV